MDAYYYKDGNPDTNVDLYQNKHVYMDKDFYKNSNMDKFTFCFFKSDKNKDANMDQD